MAATMAAKWTADYIDHLSLFHYNIKKKCMPFINEAIPGKTNMERYQVSQIMHSPSIVVTLRPSVLSVKHTLVCEPTNAPCRVLVYPFI